MDEIRRRTILDEAYATIARVGEHQATGFRPANADEQPVAESSLKMPPVETELERWKLRGDAHVAAVARERADRQRREREELSERAERAAAVSASASEDWAAWVKRQIEQEHQLMTDILTEVIARLMDEMQASNKKVEDKLVELESVLEKLQKHYDSRPTLRDEQQGPLLRRVN